VPLAGGRPSARARTVPWRRHRHSRPVAFATLLVLAAGCAEDATTSTPPTAATEPASDGLAEYDPTGDALLAQLDLLEATVVAARDALRDAAASTEDAATRASLTVASSLLLAETARTDGPVPLLPATPSERDATAERPDDLLTATATLAGDDASPRARTVLELLRDPIAGDLGAWLRDAEGVVAVVRDVAAAALGAGDDLEEAGTTVRGLDGEATRALAWTFAALDALGSGRPELAREHAARGAAHLEVVRLGIDLARTDG
jgi:hypothetical protein